MSFSNLNKVNKDVKKHIYKTFTKRLIGIENTLQQTYVPRTPRLPLHHGITYTKPFKQQTQFCIVQTQFGLEI